MTTNLRDLAKAFDCATLAYAKGYFDHSSININNVLTFSQGRDEAIKYCEAVDLRQVLAYSKCFVNLVI